jgi:hypothetical protein
MASKDRAVAGRDRAIKKIRGKRGLPARIAEACGIERTAVYQWTRVPIDRVHIVAAVLEMTPEQIRPDIFKPNGHGKRR